MRSIFGFLKGHGLKLVALGAACGSAVAVPASALAVQNRVGLGLGLSTYHDALNLSVSYDRGQVFSPSWSLGGELYGTGFDATLIGVRGLYWQRGDSLSGFYVGPKVFLAIGRVGSVIVLGGEGGWQYRFASGFDVGAGADVLLPFSDIFIGLKLNVGYAF